MGGGGGGGGGEGRIHKRPVSGNRAIFDNSVAFRGYP